MPNQTKGHKPSNQDRNIIYPPIRGTIIRAGIKTRGGDQPEEINLRQFKADLPKDLIKKLHKLIKNDYKLAYELACNYVVKYFLDDSKTYNFKYFDHGKWVEITLDLVA